MAIQSLGIGSGLDLESLVQSLVQAERVPKEQRLNEREQVASSQLSAIGKLKSSLGAFKDAATALSEGDSLENRNVTIKNPTTNSDSPFQATAGISASNGDYQVIVEQLASGSRLETADGSFAAATDTVLTTDSDTLQFSIPSGSSFTVEVTAGMTLAELRNAINDASDNFGVNANIINTGTAAGAKLVFSSSVTGTGNDLTISSLGGSSELDAITGATTVTAATNAVAQVDGIRVESETNRFDNTIAGVDLTVSKLSEQDDAGNFLPSTLSIGFDEQSAREKIDNLISTYNSLMDTVDRETRYGLTDDAPDGALAGDFTARGLRMGLASVVSAVNTESSLNNLFQLGIELNKEGRLEIGTTNIGGGSGATRLTTALDENFDEVVNLFSGSNGLATKLVEYADQYLQGDGIFSSRESSLKTQQDMIADERIQLLDRIDSFESTLRAKYTALDGTIASLNNTGSALLASLSNFSNNNNN